MSDPITVSTATEGAPDTGADVAELPLTETSHEPAGGGEGEGAPPAEPSGPPAYFQRVADYGGKRRAGWQERQRQLRSEAARAKALEDRYGQIEERNRELLQAATDLLKGRGAARAEEFPDPTLDPNGFREWYEKHSQGALQEALKPIMEHVERQSQAIEQFQQDRQAEEQRTAFINEEVSRYQQAIAEYQRDEPELAAGAEERFAGFRDALVDSVGDPNVANWMLGKLGMYFREMGFNEVAELDRMVSRLYYNIAETFRAAGLMQQGIEPGLALPTNGANGNGNGHRGPQPVRTEAQRQEEVRRRAAPGASAAPQQPAAGQLLNRSIAQETYDGLLKAGQLDSPGAMGKIRNAALKDAGGNEKEAAIIMAGLMGRAS